MFHAPHSCGLLQTCILQFTHVYSIKEIHHIDDNDLGGIYTKVRDLDFSIALTALTHLMY